MDPQLPSAPPPLLGPCATICFAAAWPQRKTPFRLTRMTVSKSSSVKSRKSAPLTMPATDEPARLLELDLPRETTARHALAPGATVAVSHRDYGLAFARGDTGEPFFLALADDWHGGLDPKPVSL